MGQGGQTQCGLEKKKKKHTVSKGREKSFDSSTRRGGNDELLGTVAERLRGAAKEGGIRGPNRERAAALPESDCPLDASHSKIFGIEGKASETSCGADNILQ